MADSDSDEEYTPSPKTQQIKKPSTSDGLNNIIGGSATSKSAPKNVIIDNSPKRKPKPIIVDCNVKIASQILNDAQSKNIITSGKVKASSKGRQSSMIMCDSLDDKNKFIDFLRNSNLEFHTFGEKEEKAQVFILKGISGYTECEIDELFARNIKCFTAKVKRYSKEDSQYPVYRVLITGMHVNLAYLQHNCKELARITITWQAIRKDKHKATQCFRCQRFGHVSKECNHEFRCVKCAGNHSPGCCKRNNRDDESVPLKCANCQGNHPANFTECESRKAYMKSLKKSPSASKVAQTNGTTTVVHKKPQDETIKSIPSLPQSSTWGAGTLNTVDNAQKQDQSESNERLTRLFTEKIAELHSTIKEMQSEINSLRSQLSATRLQTINKKPKGVSEIAGQLFSGTSSSPASGMDVT